MLQITRNFNEVFKLGEGAFGSVYKGLISSEVACSSTLYRVFYIVFKSIFVEDLLYNYYFIYVKNSFVCCQIPTYKSIKVAIKRLKLDNQPNKELLACQFKKEIETISELANYFSYFFSINFYI